MPRLGRRPHRRRATRRRETSSSRGATVDALAETFEATAGTAARRAAARLPRRGAGGGRRQPGPAVGGAARRRAGRRLRGPLRRRSSTSASTTIRDPLDELRAPLRPPRRAVRQDADARSGSSVDDDAARGARASGSRSSATTGELDALARGPATENLEERVDGVDEVDPVVLAELRDADERLRGRAHRRARVDAGRPGASRVASRSGGASGSARSASTPTRPRRPASAWSREHSEERRPRGDVRRRARAGDASQLDDEELDAPAGTLVFVRDPAMKRERDRRGGRDRSCSPSAAKPGVVVRAVAVGGRCSPPFRPRAKGEAGTRRSRLHEAGARARARTTSPLLYNLACIEMPRRPPPRMRCSHLQQAVELEPEQVADARASDTEFDAIRASRISRGSQRSPGSRTPSASARSAGTGS